MYKVFFVLLLLLSPFGFGDTDIIGSDGKPLARIASNASGFSVGHKQTSRKFSASGKIKYVNASGYPLAKVSLYEQAFKLKSATGETLWKVKYKDYGLKIADNDDMKKAYKVKHKSAGSVLMQGDRKVAVVKTVGGEYKIFLGEQLLMTVRGASPDYLAVLAIPDADWDHRLILYTELLNSQ